MKIRHIIITIITAALLILALQSCSLFGTSIDARIDMFEDDLNYDRSNLYTNLHPDETSDYDALKSPLAWAGWFPTGSIPYDIYNRSESGDTVDATIAGDGYPARQIIFYMSKDGLFDWKIESVWLEGWGVIID
jgi:hypothetical protein